VRVETIRIILTVLYQPPKHQAWFDEKTIVLMLAGAGTKTSSL
jgi:hypothetical protein